VRRQHRSNSATANITGIQKHLSSGQQRAFTQDERKDNMKTKLMALVLLAGGSLFAQTRLSNGAGDNRGYHPQATSSYSGYHVAARNEQRGFEQNRDRGFAHDRDRSRDFDRDGDRDEGRFYSNGFRGR
jgi:hypothetical protein